MDFLDAHKNTLEHCGFWSEEHKPTMLRSLMTDYKTSIIREWQAVDFIVNQDKVLIKWKKRFKPLSDEELLNDYGRS